MLYRVDNHSSFHFRKGRTILVAFFWLFGFLSGSLFFVLEQPSFSSLMRGIPFGSVSIVSFFASQLLPLVLIDLAFSACQIWLIYFIAFLKSLLFGFVSIGMLFSLGSSGWFWRFMIMLPDLISFPLLFWYLLRKVNQPRSGFSLDFLVMLSAFVMIGSIYYVYILPFTAEILNLQKG